MLALSLTLMALNYVSTSGDCYQGCFCLNKLMTCSKLDHFPRSIPKDMEGIILYEMETDSISSDLFKMVPNLNDFQIFFGKIGKISAGSFSNTNHTLKEISFFQSTIRVIETGAFKNIPNIRSVSFHNVSIGEIQGDGFSNIQQLQSFSISRCNVTVVRENALNFISKVGKFQIQYSHFGLLEVDALNNFGSIETFSVHENAFKMFKCMSLEPLLTTAKTIAFYKNTFSCSCDLQWMVNDKVTHSYLYANWCENKNSGQNIMLDDYDFEKAGCSVVNDSCTESFSVTIATPKTTPYRTTESMTVGMETDSKPPTQTIHAETTYTAIKTKILPTLKPTTGHQIQTEGKFEQTSKPTTGVQIATYITSETKVFTSKTTTVITKKPMVTQSVSSGDTLKNGSLQEGSTRQYTTDTSKSARTEAVTVPRTHRPEGSSNGTNKAESVFYKHNFNLLIILVFILRF